MREDTDRGALPVTALAAVVWSFFDGERFTDPAEFDRQVREYHVEVTEEDTWEPNEVALPVPRVRIAWFGLQAPDDEEYTDMMADLTSDNGTHFTAGELLLKLNNAVAPHLEGVDHCYFEGLYLTDQMEEDGVPVYEMMQGS